MRKYSRQYEKDLTPIGESTHANMRKYSRQYEKIPHSKFLICLFPLGDIGKR